MGGDPATILVQEGPLSLQNLQIIPIQKDSMTGTTLEAEKQVMWGSIFPNFS